MKIPEKINPAFDKFLVGGLGCGLIVLCVLLSSFYIIWQNPPRPVPTSISPELSGDLTITPGPSSTALFPLGTAGVLPTEFPTLTPGEQAVTMIPTSKAATPVPQSQYSGTSPRGKIVFTCFINQIDQICIMNADGSGRRQLTELEGTAFYASLSPDGETIYFSSRHSGSYEI